MMFLLSAQCLILHQLDASWKKLSVVLKSGLFLFYIGLNVSTCGKVLRKVWVKKY